MHNMGRVTALGGAAIKKAGPATAVAGPAGHSVDGYGTGGGIFNSREGRRGTERHFGVLAGGHHKASQSGVEKVVKGSHF